MVDAVDFNVLCMFEHVFSIVVSMANSVDSSAFELEDDDDVDDDNDDDANDLEAVDIIVELTRGNPISWNEFIELKPLSSSCKSLARKCGKTIESDGDVRSRVSSSVSDLTDEFE